MTLETDVMPEGSSASQAPAATSRTRPLYWSVRRELWENRAIWIAPVVVAAVVIVGMVIGTFGVHTHATVQRTTSGVTQSVDTDAAGPPSPPADDVTQASRMVKVHTPPMTPEQRAKANAALAVLPYDFVAMAMVVNMFLVAVFYCLGALHNERRDRSILFWKSLPVPDLTTVLAKVAVPVAILPPVTFAVAAGTELTMFLWNLGGRAAAGKNVAELFTQIPVSSILLILLYGLVAMTLWWAPIYGWLLLVSSWARRGPFLWAVLPPLLLALGEKIAFGSNRVGDLILYRLAGAYQEAFDLPTKAQAQASGNLGFALPQLDPGKFAATPGLWIGLVFAAAFIGGTVWLRRYREPI